MGNYREYNVVHSKIVDSKKVGIWAWDDICWFSFFFGLSSWVTASTVV